jgi:predicted HAD superfamily Cof-like phosphohydrolase
VWECDQAQDFNEQVDAILDLIYFAIGRLYEMGVPEEVAKMYFNNVHKANMKKVRGKTKRGHDADASKPEGWQPPFHDIGVING